MKNILPTLCLLVAFPLACDAADDTQTEMQHQAESADILLEDALVTVDDASDEAIALHAVFELGVDSGFYVVETITDDGEEVVFEVDALTGEREELERRPARRDREDLARRHRHHRRRLAQLVRDVRLERPNHRAVRARLAGDEAEIELVDRRGHREVVRRHLTRG